MMDFKDITAAVKKTTKKAAKLAMKPVNFVADPMIEANNILQQSVFGPDMRLLDTLKTHQQYSLFQRTYLEHLDAVATSLTEKKMSVKKRTAYIHAAKLIDAAPTTQDNLAQKVNVMHDLFDELRNACKTGVPTSLKETTFSIDKKTTYTKDELSMIDEQITATKTFINEKLKQIDTDIVGAFLDKKPDATVFLKTVQQKKWTLSEKQSAYQTALFRYNDMIHTWSPLVRQIVDICDHLRKYHTSENSLFWPEKTKYKQAAEAEMKKLKSLLSKERTARQKKITTQWKEVTKLQAEEGKLLEAISNDWKEFFATRTNGQKTIEATVMTTKKNYPAMLRAAQKTLTRAQKDLQMVHTATINQLTEPYDQDVFFAKQADCLHELHDTIHDDYFLLADHNWKTGIQGEISFSNQEKLLETRVSYLSEEMSTIRQHLIATKLTKHIRNAMTSTIKGFESKLDARKVYAKDLLSAHLKSLRTMVTDLQEQIKSIDKQISTYEAQLTKDKEELWDSITCKRLLTAKRTWQQDTLWATVASIHHPALQTEINTHTLRKKSLEQLEKNMHKKQQIDRTAIDEQQKTVTLVKTKEQKDKLQKLEQQAAAQAKLQTSVQKEKELCATHLDETIHLQKKYQFFAKDHQVHAQRYKKQIDDISKKLKKSPLNQWINCSAQLVNMYA
jgi:hypothetical protein